MKEISDMSIQEIEKMMTRAVRSHVDDDEIVAYCEKAPG